MPILPNDDESTGIDAVFVLNCGCILDGWSGSHPGRAWASGRRDGSLYCKEHGKWELLIGVVSLNTPKPLDEPND